MHSVLQYSYNNGEWYVPVFFCNCDYRPLLKMKTCNASKQPPSGEKEKYRTSLTMVTIFLQRRPISIISVNNMFQDNGSKAGFTTRSKTMVQKQGSQHVPRQWFKGRVHNTFQDNGSKAGFTTRSKTMVHRQS